MSYSVTKSRVSQYIGIILILAVFAGAYWYFQVYGSTLNQSQNDLNTNGLVGMWSFNGDDISGTTAYDRGTGGNNGTLTNGPAVTSGKVGQALSFDGVNDNVSVAYAASICPSNITVGTWVKFTSLTTTTVSGGASINEMYLLGKRNNSDNTDAYVFYKGSDQKISFSVNSYLNYAVSTTAVVAGQWYHIAGVYDGATIKMYVNGILEGTTTYAGGAISCNAEALTLGRRYPSAAYDAYLNGSLDEVRLYNRAIAGSEVASLYAQGSGTKSNTSISQPQGTGRLDSGLAGYWPLDNGSGTSATDASTNGNTGTLTNGPTWGTGQIGGAVTFDGTDDYIEIGSSVKVDNSDRGVIAGWIKFTSWSSIDATYNPIFSYGGPGAASAGNLLLEQRYFTNTHYLAVEQGNNGETRDIVRGSTALSLSTWYHIAVVSDGSSYRLYLNGVPETLTVFSGSNTGDWFSDTTLGETDRSVIGARWGNGALGAPVAGSIDEVRIYNRVLSADEVAQLYRLTTPTAVDTGLKGYWSFNAPDMASTTAYDRSGAGNTGTLTNGPAITEGKSGQGLSFDGTNDYVTTADYSFSVAQPFTMSAWFKPDSVTGNHVILGKPDPNYEYSMKTTGSDFEFVYWNSLSGRSIDLIETGSLAVGQWYFGAVTFDGSANSYLYLNGVLVDSDTSVSGTHQNRTQNLQIGDGYHEDGSPAYFDGSIDEARIYNRALTAAEIKSLYDVGESDKVNSSISQPQGTGRLDSGLAGYWPLDNGSGTSATDVSTNGNTGTLTNGPTWGTGQIGSAVTFDGTNDYITIAPTAAIKPQSLMTLSAWVKRNASGESDFIFWERDSAVQEEGIFFYIGTDNKVHCVFRITGTGYVDVASTTTITDTSWHMVTAALGAANLMTFYIDGVSAGSGTTTTPNTGLSISSALIGARNGGGAPDVYGSLSVDDMRFYSRTLSSDEVSQLYRLTAPTGTETGLKGYWSFNGKDVSSTTAFDSSGGGNSGTLTNGPVVTEGKIGQGLSFDGVNDYVSVTSVASLRPSLPFSFSFWIKPTTVATNQGLFGAREAIQHDGFWSSSSSDGSISISYGAGTDCSADGRRTKTSPAATLVAGQWQHIVGTLRGATDMTIYVNGVDVGGTYSGNGGSISYIYASILRLGGHGGSGGCAVAYFNGSMDEVRLYNRELTTAEIAALYNSSR